MLSEILFMFLLTGTALTLSAQTIYFVAPNGNDKNIGTEKAPFKSIETAQIFAQKAKGDITIY